MVISIYMEAGQRLRLLRSLNGLRQIEVANYLRTDQANISYLESGRFKISERYSEKLSALFGINQSWLLNGTPPIFKNKVAAFFLPPRGIQMSVKHINDLDIAIRTLLPHFILEHQTSEIGRLTTYLASTSTPLPADGLVGEIYSYYSANAHSLILFVVTESLDDLQFSLSFTIVNERLPAVTCCNTRFIEMVAIVGFLSLSDDTEHEEAQRQYGQILETLNIPETDLAAFKKSYALLTSSDASNKLLMVKRRDGDRKSARQRNLAILDIVDSMKKHNITWSDLEPFLKTPLGLSEKRY